ncbi:MAG: ribose 5-phosphate isomerase B [Clostridiales bacterium]|nr:ribose 5-phosphate isomerase B [Clostridiales bacterium]
MKIAVGSDHGGFQLKETIKAWLLENGYEVEDKGTYDEQSCDYPDYGKAVALEVAGGKADKGILACGTGIGISISANKVKGIRAAVCGDTFSARMCRLHNDANILSLGQRVTGPGLALDIVEIWLNTEFEGGRHANRIEKMMKIETEQ